MHIRKEFYRYVLPSMLAFALSGVYAIADGFFVGNALGDDALAAINVAFPLTAFLQAVGTGIGMGGAVEYAISMGSGDKDRCNRFFGVSLIALFVSSLALTLVFWLFAPQVLSLFGATGSIHQLADEYIRYISLGALFQVLGTGLVPFIRNMGGAVTAMVAMIVGFFANVFLDYLMVWVLPWGMMGAALASVLGQAATFVVCAAFFVVKRQKPRLPYKGEGGHLLKRIVGVGLSPFGLTYSPNITLILINKSAALVGGAAAVTYYAPVSYICTIVVLLLQGVSDGSQPLLSLAHGQGEHEKVKQVRTLAFRLSFAMALASLVVLTLLRRQTAALFGASPEVIREVGRILPLFLVGYLFASVSRVITAYFYATHKNKLAYALIYGEPVFLFLLLLCLPALLGILGTWASVPLSQLLAMLLGLYLLVRSGGQPYRV